jgi:type VI secretion system protein ImpB
MSPSAALLLVLAYHMLSSNSGLQLPKRNRDMADSGQKFIKRNRPPRVQIQYQDPYNAERMVELPFVMGVMSDLSGNASEVEKPAIAERKFLDIDMDNFDSRMKAVKPAVTFRVANRLGNAKGDESMGVTLTFEKMSDFNPAQVVRQVPALAKLLKAREQLANLQRYMDGKVAAEDQIKALLKDPELMQLLRDRQAAEQAGQEREESTEQEPSA